jgi:hypothetical protein
VNLIITLSNTSGFFVKVVKPRFSRVQEHCHEHVWVVEAKLHFFLTWALGGIELWSLPTGRALSHQLVSSKVACFAMLADCTYVLHACVLGVEARRVVQKCTVYVCAKFHCILTVSVRKVVEAEVHASADIKFIEPS